MVTKHRSKGSLRPPSRQLSLFGLISGIGKLLGLRARTGRPAQQQTDERDQSLPELATVWTELRLRYFPEHEELAFYKVRWSRRRQKRTLASCHIKKRVVNVAGELKHASYKEWIEPLLYHEMCHARLGAGLQKVNGRTPWHGGTFRELERRHPGTAALQEWINSGGWRKAVRSARARKAFRKINAPL